MNLTEDESIKLYGYFFKNDIQYFVQEEPRNDFGYDYEKIYIGNAIDSERKPCELIWGVLSDDEGNYLDEIDFIDSKVSDFRVYY
jgi:hypothetical protein